MSRSINPRPRSWLASRFRRLSGFTILFGLLSTTELGAQQAQALPQPVPLPAQIKAPQDTLYPGVIEIHIDASDVLRRIYQIHETIPVSGPGKHTFLFPEWTPGDHAPDEPLEKLAGLVCTANGSRLPWVRDTVNVHAFSVDVPAGMTSLEVHYQYLGSTGVGTGPVLITPTMLDLQWQSLILYPAGYFIRDIKYQPTVRLPVGWTYLTSLDGGRTSGDTVDFPSTTLDALIDQPVMAGRYLKQLTLTEDPVSVRLDVAAQDPADLAALPGAAKQFSALMPKAYKLWPARPFVPVSLLV